jgi:4-hydroxy-2-oxoheptanedioate aldolase
MGVQHYCIGWDVRILYQWWQQNGAGMKAMLEGGATPAAKPAKTGTY